MEHFESDGGITLRLETPADHYAVEQMTRDAFWKFWEPDRKICDEHLLVHRLRSAPSFLPELDYIAERNGTLAGHIIYTKSEVLDNDGHAHQVLTFGPLTVSPAFQNQGIGRALMRHTFAEARQLGYRGVIIYGHPDYYSRVGFRPAGEFGIATAEGGNFDAFMALPLYAHAFDAIEGRHDFDSVYKQLTQEDALEFDRRFPPKEAFLQTPVQVLLDRLGPPARAAIEGQGFQTLEILRAKSQREISALGGIDNHAVDTIIAVMRERGYRWGR
jgi:Predicted acetyltransferase